MRLHGGQSGHVRLGAANDDASTVTAALIVIGEEILSGRTKDENISPYRPYLDDSASTFARCGSSADIEAEIVAAVNALRAALHLCLHHRRHRPDP